MRSRLRQAQPNMVPAPIVRDIMLVASNDNLEAAPQPQAVEPHDDAQLLALKTAWKVECQPAVRALSDEPVAEFEASEESDEDAALAFALPDDDEFEEFDDELVAAGDGFILGDSVDAEAAPEPREPVLVAFKADDADDGAFNAVLAEDDHPPFDPPEFAELDQGLRVPEPEAPLALTAPVEAKAEEDQPPFDPPEAEDLDQGLQRVDAEVEEDDAVLLLGAPPPAQLIAKGDAWRSEAVFTGRPVPPIVIQAAWDRPECAALLEAFAADRRMRRADIEINRGGLDSAIVAAGRGEPPSLIIVDSTLTGAQLLQGLDRLRMAAPQAQLIVIGTHNDITLLRDLTARGVTQYIVAPTRPEPLLRAVCALYDDHDTSKTIAVIGARGGVGASTIAYNIAWSIATRQGARTALVDLDLAFGAAAFTRQITPPGSVADILSADDEDDVYDRVVVEGGERLSLIASPSVLGAAPELSIAAVERVSRCVRRACPYVVLDLPHMWSGWISHVLERADEVVIVASPELASLRNAENFLKALRDGRPNRSAPHVILAQSGVPKRPEITLRDFCDALHTSPVAAIPFDPALFGAAAMSGQALAECEPASKITKSIDDLSWMLSGRDPAWVRAPRAVPVATTPAAPQVPVPALVEVVPEPARAETREVEQAANAPVEEPQAESITFAAPIEVEFEAPTEKAEPPAPDIAVDAPLLYADYFAKARYAMEQELDVQPPPRKRASWGFRVAGLMLLLLAVTAASQVWLERIMLGPTRAAAAVALAPVEAPPPTAPGDTNAEYDEALNAIGAGRMADAFEQMSQLAERGHAPAQLRLAQMYERGEGVEVNLESARLWTERAAAAGERLAMHDLGVYYARGEGGAQDDAAAFRWFRQAAEFGVADSQYNLGVLYERGRGVDADPREALFWFMLAAAQGDASAAERVVEAENTMATFDLEQARVRAQAFRARFNGEAGSETAGAAPIGAEAPAVDPEAPAEE